MNTPALASLPTPDLLSLYGALMTELRGRGVCRGMNNPVADYAELLVAAAVGAELRPPSSAGHDLVDAEGVRYEVKARRLTGQAGGRELSALRGLDERKFDFLAGVLFTEDFRVHRAALIPWEVVRERAAYVPHTNAWRFMLVDSVWGLPGVRVLDLGGAPPQAVVPLPLPRAVTHGRREYDHTRYDLVGGRAAYRNLTKGRAMLALFAELAAAGVRPEDFAARIPRSEAFLLRSAPGALDPGGFQAQVNTVSGGLKRYYAEEGELVLFGGRTYALTSQWTLDLFNAARQGLAGLCATHGVSLAEAGRS